MNKPRIAQKAGHSAWQKPRQEQSRRKPSSTREFKGEFKAQILTKKIEIWLERYGSSDQKKLFEAKKKLLEKLSTWTEQSVNLSEKSRKRYEEKFTRQGLERSASEFKQGLTVTERESMNKGHINFVKKRNFADVESNLSSENPKFPASYLQNMQNLAAIRSKYWTVIRELNSFYQDLLEFKRFRDYAERKLAEPKTREASNKNTSKKAA